MGRKEPPESEGEQKRKKQLPQAILGKEENEKK